MHIGLLRFCDIVNQYGFLWYNQSYLSGLLLGQIYQRSTPTQQNWVACFMTYCISGWLVTFLRIVHSPICTSTKPVGHQLPPSRVYLLVLLMTLVPVQKLCVNIYVYICVYIPYTSPVIGRIYNGSVIQYWRSCTPSRSIGECVVPDLNAILCFLWFTNCVLLFDNNLILGCLWHCVFV